tara:strand:+ start:14921 stop:15607 length:687 start_codon:yes stop_codon:yes gene_type:complete
MKNYIKNYKQLYKFLLNIREILRILYNTKTRSRFFWTIRNGDNTLSLDYPLDENSVIFDVGAYEGNFTKKINQKFNCNIHCFEPLTKYYNFLVEEFKEFPKVRLYNFGLLDQDKEIKISNIDGSSSIYQRPEGDVKTIVNMKSFESFVKENNITHIDFLYMNIEGSEYKVLNQILDTGLINDINYMQIQFHNFVKDSKKMRRLIRYKLRKTHKCVFNFPFIWERWDRK